MSVLISGSLMPASDHTPLDERSVIDTLAHYEQIKKPYVGLQFRAADSGLWYEVTAVKEVTQGLSKEQVIERYKPRDLRIVLLNSEDEYQAISPKDPQTIYAW